MPTIRVEIIDAIEQHNQPNTVIQFTAEFGNKRIKREVLASQFTTWNEFAQWLIDQEPDFTQLTDLQKTLDITYHTEQVDVPGTGTQVDKKIVDNVVIIMG